MSKDVDLKQFEKRAYLSFFRDGLWDLVLGLFLVGWGAGLVWEQAAYSGIWVTALYFLVLGVKRRWITPRTGYVKMDGRAQRLRAGFVLLLGALALLGVFVLFLYGSRSRPDWLDDYFPLLFSFVLAVPVMFIAAWFMVRRFYAWAALIVAGGALTVWLGIAWAHTFFGAGGVIALAGAAFLVTFLRANRRPAAGGPYAEE